MESILDYYSPVQTYDAHFYYFPSISNFMFFSTQILAQTKSQEYIGHIKHFDMHMSPMAFIILGCAVSKVGCILTFDPDKMLFGILQS